MIKRVTRCLTPDFWQQMRHRPLLWDTLVTTAWSTVGKAAGFLIPFFVAAWFGVSGETDAFFFAYGLILFLSGNFAPVVENVIVPYIIESRSRGEEVGEFVGEVLIISGLGLSVLTGAVLLIIKPVLSAVTRFDPATLNLVYLLLLETAPLIVLLTWTSVLSGALNAYKKFSYPALSPAFRAAINLVVIFTLKNRLGVQAIALGYLAGELGRLLILILVVRREGIFKFRWSLNFDRRIRDFCRTASYQTVGMVAVWLNPIVDKTMASWLGEGSVSVLYYADRLYIIPITFLATGLLATTLSHWSTRCYESGHAKLKEDVQRVVKAVGWVTAPVMVLLLIFHQPIVRIALGRGAFTRANLIEVGWAWAAYLLGLLPYILGRVYCQGHIVLKNTRTLMLSAFYVNGLNILLNYLLMRCLGVAGIALGTTVTSVFTLVYLSQSFYRRINKLALAR